METHDHRWQDFVISSQRTAVELVAAALVLIFVAIATLVDDDQVRDAHWQATPRPALHTEEAPSLATIAKRHMAPAASEVGL